MAVHSDRYNIFWPREGLLKTIPGFHPAGALRATKFAPGEFVESSVAARQMPLTRTLHQKQKLPRCGGIFLFLAVGAVCCEPVSDQIPCFPGKIQGKFLRYFKQRAWSLPLYPDRRWPAGSSTASAKCPVPQQGQVLLLRLYLACP